MSDIKASAGPHIGIEAYDKLCAELYSGGLGLLRHMDLPQLCDAPRISRLGSSEVVSLFLARVRLDTKEEEKIQDLY